MPIDTAIAAATRSATSRTAVAAGACRRCARSAWAGSSISAVEPQRAGAARRLRPHGRASPGKDSVTGHWELMGLVLERPFPVFPHGFPAELIAEFERRIGRGDARQHGRVRHGDHRRARRRAHARPAGRSSTRRPTASSRSPRTKTSCRFRELYRICEIAYELVAHRPGRRPGDRAAVRRRRRARSSGPRTAATSR